MYRDVDLAYIAGFIDGEGCIGAYTHSKDKACLQIRLVMYNTNLDILYTIREILGCGTVRKGRKGTLKFKQAYTLDFTKTECVIILPHLLEHFKLKRPQAELALEFIGLKKCPNCGT